MTSTVLRNYKRHHSRQILTFAAAANKPRAIEVAVVVVVVVVGSTINNSNPQPRLFLSEPSNVPEYHQRGSNLLGTSQHIYCKLDRIGGRHQQPPPSRTHLPHHYYTKISPTRMFPQSPALLNLINRQIDLAKIFKAAPRSQSTPPALPSISLLSEPSLTGHSLHSSQSTFTTTTPKSPTSST